MAGAIRIAVLANGKQARSEIESVGKTGSKVGGLLKTGLAAGALAAGAGLATAFVGGVKAAEGYVAMQRRTAAVIKSTGNAAKISVKGVKRLAGQLETMSGVDEDLIINGQNVLATFTDVRNETGKGNKVFDRATEAALNMSVALGTDLKGANIQLGKALNNPIKGISALSRSGVTFTEQQKAQITTLVKSGKTLEAQKIILSEVEKEFGGAAKAAGGEGLTGAVNRAKDAFGDFFRDLTISALPTLTKVTDYFTNTAFPAFTDFAEGIRTKVVPKIRQAIKAIGDKLPKIDLKGVIGDLKTQAKGFVQPFIDGFTAGVKTGNWGPFGTALGAALSGAVGKLTGLIGDVAGAIKDWAASVDWLQVGKSIGRQALPFAIGFGNALFDPLSKPQFWKDNWDEVLLFAVAFVPFGKFGSVAGKIGAKLGFGEGIIGGIIKSLESAVGLITNPIGRFFAFIGKKFVEGFKAAFPAVDLGVVRFFDGIRLRFLYAGEAIAKAVGDLFIRIGGAFGKAIVGTVKWGARLVGGIVRGIFGALRTLLTPFAQGIRLLAESAGQAAVRAIGWGARLIGGIVRGMFARVSTLTLPFRLGIRLIVQDVVRLGGRLYTSGAAAVGRLRAGIASRAGRFRDVLFDAGLNVMQGFLSGIQSFYNNHVRPYLNWITSRLPFEKGPASRDKKILKKSGELVMGGFQVGLESRYDGVKRSLNGFTGSLSGAAGASSAAGSLAASVQAAPVAVAAGGASTVTLVFEPSGDPLTDVIFDAFLKRLRVKGGARVVNGKVVFG